MKTYQLEKKTLIYRGAFQLDRLRAFVSEAEGQRFDPFVVRVRENYNEFDPFFLF